VTSAGALSLSYLHSDQVGSVIAQSGATGAVSNKYTYSPFGESALLSGTTFGCAGQRYDSENGLYYARARHYSPTIGRFMQTDPIGYGGGLNWNTYVDNDPLNQTDPSGLLNATETGPHFIGQNFTGPGGRPDEPPGTSSDPALIPYITDGGDTTEGTADDCLGGASGGIFDMSGQRGQPTPLLGMATTVVAINPTTLAATASEPTHRVCQLLARLVIILLAAILLGQAALLIQVHLVARVPVYQIQVAVVRFLEAPSQMRLEALRKEMQKAATALVVAAVVLVIYLVKEDNRAHF
jgi:RHS repeat-associated protein